MTEPQTADFFISYTQKDRNWAEWIGWQLEAAGYSIIMQAWDFRPGSDFILEMQKATTTAKRTIAVLSTAYLEGMFTQPEWAAALAKDPTGSERTLVPVRVADCELRGFLKTRVYIDLA